MLHTVIHVFEHAVKITLLVFVMMVAMLPREAFMLFGLLFGAGVIFSWITDKIVRTWNIRLSYKCELHQHHPDREGLKHYMLEHIWQHIIKRHIWKIFLWVLGAMLIIDIALYYGDITALSAEYTVYFIFAAALIGIIPQSGPNLVFGLGAGLLIYFAGW
jgi:hypothetical protein